MALALLLMQESTAPIGGETTAAGGTTVYLAPEQMQQLAEQAQGNTAHIEGFLLFVVLAVAGLLWKSASY